MNSVRIVDILVVMRFLIAFATDHVVVRIVNFCCCSKFVTMPTIECDDSK